MANLFSRQRRHPDELAFSFGWYLREGGSPITPARLSASARRSCAKLDRRITAIVLVNRSDAAPLALAEALIAHESDI